MGVDYFVERGCPVQRALTPQGFLQAMMRRRQLRIFSATHIMAGGELQEVATPESLPVSTVRDGVVVAQTSMSRDDAAALDRELAPWAKHCEGCPARISDQAFGCYGYIGYPIHEATERWLVARALRMGVASAVSVEVLAQAGITGARCADLRARNRAIFESELPLVATWDLADGTSKHLSSDLLFELALFELPGNPRLLPLAAVLLGLVPPEAASIEALQSWMTYPAMLHAKLVAPAADDDVRRSFVDYLGGIVAAARSSSQLVVDA